MPQATLLDTKTPTARMKPTTFPVRPLPPGSSSSYLDLVKFFETILPPSPHHVPLIYHTPRRTRRPLERLVLSVTATPGVYEQTNETTAIFLHRPWGLERSRLGLGNLVLTSHQRLDEILTTGYNLPLMEALGVDIEAGKGEIVGYKGDPERKMGIAGTIPQELSRRSFREWKDKVSEQFEGLEGDNYQDLVDTPFFPEGMERIPKYIACMNAYEPTIINRLLSVLSSTENRSEVEHDTPLAVSPHENVPPTPSEILYITGEPRPLGSESAKTLGLPTLFVGHNRSEVWAIKYLAQKLREAFGDRLEVIVVDEEEIVIPRVKKQKTGREPATKKRKETASMPLVKDETEDTAI